MAYANGRLPSPLLTTVESNTLLLKRDAPCYRAFRMYAADRGRRVSIAGAGTAGAGGYRSFRTQDEMFKASHGNRVYAARYGLNPYSSVPLAAAGYSTHGKTDHARTDLVGTSLDWIVGNVGRFGGRREFGPADPNHVIWDQAAAATWRHTVPATKVTITGRTGTQDSGNAFWKRVQLFARLGGYRGPVDGKMGPASWAGVDVELKAAGYPGGYPGLLKWGGGTVRKTAATLNRL